MLYYYLAPPNSRTNSVFQNINKKLFYLQLFTNLNTILNVFDRNEYATIQKIGAANIYVTYLYLRVIKIIDLLYTL